MRLFLKKCFIVFLVVIYCVTSVNAQDALKSSDKKIQVWNFGKGILTYKYKTPTMEAIQEWKESAIADDLINLNLISIPDIVIDPINNITSYPFFDITRLPYEVVVNAYNLSKTNSERKIWTFDGYEISGDNLDYKPIKDLEFKIDPQLRPPYGKYEHSSERNLIPLAKVSNRIARKIFPEKYNLIDDADLNNEAIDFWKNVFSSDLPIVLTEGQKKALSLLSQGYIAISIHQPFLGTHVELVEGKLKLSIVNDLRKILNNKSRIFYLSYDTDENPYVRKIVYSSLLFVAEQIEMHGSQVKIIVLPLGTAKGPDDYIYQYGASQYRDLYDSAINLDKFRTKYPRSLKDDFDLYLKDQNHLKWCFEPCEDQCMLKEINKTN